LYASYLAVTLRRAERYLTVTQQPANQRNSPTRPASVVGTTAAISDSIMQRLNRRKLSINKQTLRSLSSDEFRIRGAGGTIPCPRSEGPIACMSPVPLHPVAGQPIDAVQLDAALASKVCAW
jgi:hypothetical protein